MVYKLQLGWCRSAHLGHELQLYGLAQHVMQMQARVNLKPCFMQVYTRLDQPQAALQQYKRVAAAQPGQIDVLLGQGRIHDAMNDLETGMTLYKEVNGTFAASDQGAS